MPIAATSSRHVAPVHAPAALLSGKNAQNQKAYLRMTFLQTLASDLTSLVASIQKQIDADAGTTPTPTPTPTPPTSLTITAIAPTSGPVGTPVTITGTGFGSTQGTVAMGFYGMVVTSWADTEVVAAIPWVPAVGLQYDFVVGLPSGASLAFGPPYFTVTDSTVVTPPPTPTPTPVTTPTPTPAPPPTPTPVTTVTASLQVTAPATTQATTTVFTTDPNNPTWQQYGDAVSDAEMQIAVSKTVPFAATTTGSMQNVEAWTHNKMLARFTPDSAGNVSGTIDLSGETNGPLVLDVYCWDGPPGGVFKFHCKQRLMLFITGSTDYVVPTPLGAAGMKQVFADEFTALSVSSTDATKTWTPTEPQGAGTGQFGDAVFIDPDHTGPGIGSNPFTILDGFLRVRCKYEPDITDPFGWKRVWTTGMLATGRPSGVDGLYWKPPFYTEARMLVPIGETPWPAFWMVTQEGLVAPTQNIEIDITENYGIYPQNWRSGVIHYPPGVAQVNFPVPGASPGTFPVDQLNFEFHTYGALVTATEISIYVDNALIGSVPMPALTTGPTAFFAMLDLSLGSGWPVVVPPAGHYDMWVDYFHVYAI